MLVITAVLNAQSWGKEGWCLGGFAGATSFAGDIMHTPTSDNHRISDTRYDFGLSVEKVIYPGINFRLAGSYGKLGGIKDLDMEYKPQNQEFESRFFDYHFDLKLDALKCILGGDFPFSAYALMGVGGCSYKSKWYRTDTGEIKCDTAATAAIYPIGVGAGFDVGPAHVFAEGTWNVMFSDALDAHVSNNTDHWIQDSYLVFLVGATYEIGGTSVDSYRAGKSGATKKAQKHRKQSSKNLHKRTSSYRKRATSSKRHYTNGGRTQPKRSYTNSMASKRRYTTSSRNGNGMNIKKSKNTNSGKNKPKYPVHY